MVAALVVGMTTKQQKMLALAESCETFEELLKLVSSTVERQFAEDAEVPAKLAAFLAALDVATEAAAALDEEVA